MRIGVFTYNLPTVGQKRGGIEQVAHDLSEGLARRGHEVIVWSHDPAPEGAAYRVRPLPWRKFVSSWLGRRVTMGYAGNLLALLPDYGGVDVVVAHGDSLLLPLRGKPVVRVMLGSALGEALSARTPWRFLTQAGVYPQELLTALLQTSVGISENARRYNPFVRHTIPIGVDLGRFHADPSAKSAEPSVLFVGGLTGRKRGSLLVKWFTDTVRVSHPEATLHIVGPPGPAVPGVKYHTGLDALALAALYRSAWVYASPSSYEGFGLPYVEALASGTPVIATPNPGSREVLDGGRYGLLVPDEEFAGALSALLSDPARRAQLAESGVERARVYSTANMVDQYEALLAEVSGRRHTGGAS